MTSTSARKVAALLMKIALTVILIAISLELSMIVLEPYLFRGFYEYDPDLGFRVRAYSPGADGILTNRFGFNDRDYPLEKTPGTFRMLVVGDSFNWVGGREGNYTALLRRMFELRDGYRVEVINVGYPMTHTGEQLAMLEKYGLQYNPDLVVLGFFVGNDFVDADPDRKRIVLNDLYMDISRRRELRVLGYPIIPRSRLRLFIEQKYQIYRELRKAGREGHGLQEQQGTFSEETYLGIERARLEFFNSSPSRVKDLQANVAYALHSIAEMDALLKARKIKLIVAMYPDEVQVNEALLKAVVERFRLRREDYDLALGQNLLRAWLESCGIPFIDFLDRFRAEGRARDLYIPRDTHWNRAGNQLAAELLFEDLAKRVEQSGR